jgi:hypothetical protein
MERESGVLSETFNKEFGQKLTELQNAFMFHVKETDASITAMSSKIDKFRNLNDVDQESGRTAKSSLVRKILGS